MGKADGDDWKKWRLKCCVWFVTRKWDRGVKWHMREGIL
jgi:hypothetical protein